MQSSSQLRCARLGALTVSIFGDREMKHARKQSAFTLLELLISLSIIAILTAIAVPQFSEYKKRAFDMRASTDLRNVAIAEEAYFLDYESYLSCNNQNCIQLPGIGAISRGTALQITATQTGFTGTASHPKGSGKTFTWDTNLGGMQ